MKTQPSLMQNLPAVAANIFSNYCESSPLAHLFNKVPSGTANFLNNNVFNNGGMTRRNLEAFFKDLPVSQVKVEQPLVDQNEIGLSTKKSSKSLEKKEGKPKKVTHSCPHCNFETVMSQHMKSHLVSSISGRIIQILSRKHMKDIKARCTFVMSVRCSSVKRRTCTGELSISTFSDPTKLLEIHKI